MHCKNIYQNGTWKLVIGLTARKKNATVLCFVKKHFKKMKWNKTLKDSAADLIQIKTYSYCIATLYKLNMALYRLSSMYI